MNSETRLYELFSPHHNLNIQADLGKAMLHPLPGMFALDISRVFQNAEYKVSKEIKEIPNNEEMMIGFRSPFCLLIASTYISRGKIGEVLARNNLSGIGNDQVVEIGKKFLGTGAALLQSDPSGKLALSEGVKHFKANFSGSDFHRGIDVAEKVFNECFSAPR